MITRDDVERAARSLFEDENSGITPQMIGLIKNIKPEIPGQVEIEGTGDFTLRMGGCEIPIHVDSAIPKDMVLIMPKGLVNQIMKKAIEYKRKRHEQSEKSEG
jgi:hypothetical protein